MFNPFLKDILVKILVILMILMIAAVIVGISIIMISLLVQLAESLKNTKGSIFVWPSFKYL